MRILVVEDDGITAEALSSLLGDQNYAVDVAQTHPAALELIEAFQYDLVLLDVQIPQGDGISLCRQLRSQGQAMPILMLTARDSGHDKAIGLDAGADDYVVKPFHPEELSARVRALLRRSSGVTKPVLEWAGLQLTPSSCEVSYNGQLLTLTPKEYALLELFLRNHKRVFSCGVILEQIWSFEEMPGEEAVRTHIKGLRQKLKKKGAPADLIETVYGIGYRLKPQTGQAPEAEPPSPEAPPTAEAKQKTLEAVAQIWERFKDQVFEQVQVVEQAVTASLYGELNDTLCQQARKEAHSLAGSLGTFGFPDGSKMARQLESWLKDGAMTHPPSASRMVDLVRSLRDTLNQPVAGPSKLPGVIKTQPTPVDMPIDPSDRLMVVDDDPLVLAAVRSLLEPWGLQVTTLDDPRQLWDTLESATPSLLILDIEMPHENGITLCQQVRDHEQWGGLPIMILTAHTDAGMVNQVFAAGADDFVTKPIVGPELVSRILHRLERMRLWQRFAATPQLPQPQDKVAPDEELFHLLVDGVKDYAIYMLDPQGTIVSWNRGAEKIKGYTAEEILGEPFASFYLPEEQEQNLPEIDLAIARREGRCERIGGRLHKGGACFWGDVVITALQDEADQTLRGYAVVTRDITDRKQLDDALQKSRGQLEVRVAERTAELVGVNERLRQELEERKRTQEALRISQARFAGILDIADDAIISVDVHQIITLFNQGAEKIFGYTAQEVLGQNLSILIPNRYSMLHRGYVRQFGQSDGTARRMGDRREIYGRRKDGSEFPAEASISKLGIGDEAIFTVILRDISLRKASEERLAALSHQNELILNAMGEGICGVDLQGRITFMNPAVVNLLGYSREELIGQSIQVLLAPPSEAPACQLHASGQDESGLFNGAVQQGQRATFWRKDHTSLPVEYMSTPIHEQAEGRPDLIGSVITFKDITERQVVERMKDEFVSVVSHELRTPLTSIHGSLGMLASGMLDSDPATSKRLLEIAVTSTERLVRLINDILDVERIESGKVKMHLQPCDAAELVSRAIDVMQPMAEQAHIGLEVETEAIALHADPDRIHQTLTNLLSNAIKFSEAGSTIRITCQPIQPADAESPTQAQFAVSDRGRGIPEDKLETIFERFQQVDASDSRNQEGTGLGLAICRNIVQQHQGEISVKSTLGEGSTFTFWLPLKPDAKLAPSPEAEPSKLPLSTAHSHDAKNPGG